jgi:vacuolar-type H+-ATPase subunit H
LNIFLKIGNTLLSIELNPRNMVQSEIDQIKKAEKEAIGLISAAQQEAERKISEATKQGERLVELKRKQAFTEVQSRRDEAMKTAFETARKILLEAEHLAERLEEHSKDRIPIAVKYIVEMATGRSRVLSKKDEEGYHRSS